MNENHNDLDATVHVKMVQAWAMKTEPICMKIK